MGSGRAGSIWRGRRCCVLCWCGWREQRHQLVITSHHILWDGWSMPVLTGELLGLYRAGGSEAGLAPVAPVARYLDWLAGWDRGAAEAAWAGALAGVGGPTLIAPHASGRAVAIPGSVRRELGSALTGALGGLARGAGVTLNTLIQAGWALYLSRMTGQHDVVFGATVSGRPAEIPDVEQMVGLFINTIPVRVQIREDETLAGLLARVQAEQAALLALPPPAAAADPADGWRRGAVRHLDGVRELPRRRDDGRGQPGPCQDCASPVPRAATPPTTPSR